MVDGFVSTNRYLLQTLAEFDLAVLVSKQVVQMKPWQRTWAARRLSNQFVSAIERASAPNRVPRGLVVDLDRYNNASVERPFATSNR